MKEKVLVVGMGESGTTGLSNLMMDELRSKDIDIVVVDTELQEVDDSFVLNGVVYKPIQTKKPKRAQPNINNSQLNSIIAIASSVYLPYIDKMYSYGETQYERKLPEGINIITEYGLIQNKKSKLSKWERDMVVYIFEKNYYRVQNIVK